MIDDVTTLSPDEVITALSKIGVTMTRRNLLKLEKAGCISPAERGGGGPGGAYAKYHPDAVLQAFTTWHMTHGSYNDGTLWELVEGAAPRFSLKAIKVAREIFESGKSVDEWFAKFQAKPVLAAVFLKFALDVYSFTRSLGQLEIVLENKRSRKEG